MKIGLTVGCFDLFHRGHRHLLRHCVEQCTLLIVAVNNDESVKRLKGPQRPHNNRVKRMADVRDEYFNIQQLRMRTALVVVIPFDGDDEVLVAAIKPDVVFRGHDQSERPSAVPVIRVSHFPGFSTSLSASRSYK